MKNVLIILLSILSLTVFAQQKKVAVYVTGEQSGISKVLGDQLVAGFAKSGKYTAVERTSSFLAELGKEQGYQRSGAVGDNEIARIGDQFGVNYVCVADVSDVFGEKYISARLIDVITVEIINTSNATSKLNNMQELLTITEGLAKELTAKTVQEKAKEAEAEQRANELEVERLKKAVSNGYIQADNIMFIVGGVSRMNYKAAKKEAPKVRIGGYTDWRLPTQNELSRILSLSRTYHKLYEEFPNYEDYCSHGYRPHSYNDYGHFFWCADGNYYLDGSFYAGYLEYTYPVIFVRDVR